MQKTRIRGTGTDLQLQGTFPVSSNAPMSLLALGTIDLRIAQILNPDVTTGGQIQLNVNGYGARKNPDVQGEIKIVNATFAGHDIPVGLQDGNGTLRLTTNRLEIEQFRGNVSGGTLTATGGQRHPDPVPRRREGGNRYQSQLDGLLTIGTAPRPGAFDGTFVFTGV